MVQIATTFAGVAALAAGVVKAAPQYGAMYGSGYGSGYSSAADSMAYGSYTTSTAMADMAMSTSAMMDEESSSSMMMEDSSSSMMEEATSTAYGSYSTSSALAEYTTTSSAYESSSTVSYGSGSSSWGSSGYNDCVQQCVAEFGAPMATYTPPTSTSTDDSYGGSYGTGVTHTVIVAPTQGVLRYVPFALNASVGDTIEFNWHANMHTVTKSSELEICNKTLDAPFTSGVHNESFTFTQVVNDTNPLFYYCGVPTHCQKGMFGIINPPSALASSMSVGSMMPSMIANNSDIAAMNAYAMNMTQGSPMAASWANSLDMSKMPSDSYALVAENVMYNRAFLAANPSVMQADGSINMSASSSLSWPQDLSAVVAKAAASSSSAAAPSSTGAASPSTTTGVSGAASGNSNGARSLGASTTLAGVVAVAAMFFVL